LLLWARFEGRRNGPEEPPIAGEGEDPLAPIFKGGGEEKVWYAGEEKLPFGSLSSKIHV
jgi:hypothetical protein